MLDRVSTRDRGCLIRLVWVPGHLALRSHCIVGVSLLMVLRCQDCRFIGPESKKIDLKVKSNTENSNDPAKLLFCSKNIEFLQNNSYF